MTKDEIYAVWKPDASPWARWAKPVLLSFLPDNHSSITLDDAQLRQWKLPFEQATAIVADLGGAEGVWAGIALALVGYRPIPVYNACPFPNYPRDPNTVSVVNAGSPRALTAVDVESIVTAISEATWALRKIVINDEAPPAFLVDKNRKGHGRPDPGWFDNRSFVSASDFPSATFLIERGIREVVLVSTDPQIGSDLKSVLLSWQGAGIQIAYQPVWLEWNPEPKLLRSPSLLRRLLNRVLLVVGYPGRENGAFGEWVRASSS